MTTEQFNKMIETMDYAMSELTANALSNQRCDITGWSLTESMSNIAQAMMESNRLKGLELQLEREKFEFTKQTTQF